MGRCAATITVLWLLLSALWPVRSGATTWPIADTVFEHVASDNELPNGASPFALAEDGDGFLWEGSDDGLARYDGHGFRLYTADRSRPEGLPDSLILALHTDVRGRLWIGTGSGGLARYDRDGDRFVRYPAGPNGVSSPSVSAIADDGARGLWIGTQGGLDRLDFASGRIERVRHSGVAAHSPGSAAKAILVGRDGALWLGTDRGLLIRTRAGARFMPVRFPLRRGELPDISSLLEDRAGRIWIGTAAHGAFWLEPGARIARALREGGVGDGNAPSDLASDDVLNILAVGSNEIWFGTVGDGIVAVDTRTFRTRRIRHDPFVPSSLLDDTVRVLYRDRAGLIWTGTDRSLSYTILQPAVATVFGPSSRAHGLTEPNVQAVLALPGDRVWLGLGKNGVDVFGAAGARVGALRPDPSAPYTALAPGQINGFAEGVARVYVGTARGLYVASPDGRRVTRMSVAGRDPVTSVRTLFAKDGVLWFGGDDGLWEVRPAASGTRVLLGGATAPVLTDRRVTAFAPGAKQTLWIGTENGLNRYDPRTHRLERFLAGPGETSLSSGFIATLLADSSGRLWIGTQGGGLDVLEPGGAGGRARFRHIGATRDLPSENVDTLLQDGRGNVWASTDDGLAVIDERTLDVRPLGRPDGVAIAGYWWHSGARTTAGDLIFGGLGGMTIVRPQLLTDTPYHPPIVFTDIRVGGKSIASGRYASGASDVPIEIAPGANSLAVEFSALAYSAPGASTFAYRLEGFDKNWTYADSSRRSANYTNLPPGDYALHVHGTNREGTWTSGELTLRIRVIPAWWQTLWFKLLVALCLCAAIALLVYARTRYLQSRQRGLERDIAERTAELRKSNAELAASTAELIESKIRLESLAYLDGLTELPNRRMFTDCLQSQIAQMQRNDDGRFALMFIDLDHFKSVNDTLGHQAGDAVLIAAAARLRAVVRKADVVARFGGDEFAILIGEPTVWSGVEATCRRIVEAFAEPVAFEEYALTTTPSIGIATYPQCGRTQNELYKAADLALYKAKNGGRNTWRWYVPELIV